MSHRNWYTPQLIVYQRHAEADHSKWEASDKESVRRIDVQSTIGHSEASDEVGPAISTHVH